MRFPPPQTLAFCLFLLPVTPAVLAQGSWTVTPVPTAAGWSRAQFADVTAIGPQDAWAVGQYRTPIPPFSSEGHTLAMHWDGTSWSRVPTPSPSPYPGGAENALHAVDAVGSDDVWAGGERYGNAGGLSVGAWIHVQHWDGTSWSVVPVPGPPGGSSINFSGTRIHEVLALASDDVWFGGAWATPNTQQASLDWHPLAMHWDGSNMNVHPTPVVHDGGSGFGFKSVSMSALAPDDIWAACSKNSAGGSSLLNVILHWDGSTWSRVSVPDASVRHTLHSIEALAPDDVWVFGEVSFSTAQYILHYDGSSWTELATGPSATASHAFGGNHIYAAESAVSHYDGSGWTVEATFPNHTSTLIRALESDGGAGLWAVGGYWSSGLVPFAARAGALTHPVLGIDGLESGSTATFSVHGAGAGSAVLFGISLSGSGPLPTPFGNVHLSPPIGFLPIQTADANGDASVSLSVPGGLAGLPVFGQAGSVTAGGAVDLSNWLLRTVR